MTRMLVLVAALPVRTAAMPTVRSTAPIAERPPGFSGATATETRERLRDGLGRIVVGSGHASSLHVS